MIDLGTFEGFSFRNQEAIFGEITAQEVIDWEHDVSGEAEFWPSGDSRLVAKIFQGQSAVTAFDLQHLESLLATGDDQELMSVYIALHENGGSIETLDADRVDELASRYHVYAGATFCDLYEEALYDLFELYYPQEYKLATEGLCPFLQIDQDVLRGPEFSTVELDFGDRKVLAVKFD